MMATGILKGFGLSDAQLHKAHEAWLEIPNAVEVIGKTNITLRQYDRLLKLAESQHRSLSDLVNEQVSKAVQDLAGEGAASK